MQILMSEKTWVYPPSVFDAVPLVCKGEIVVHRSPLSTMLSFEDFGCSLYVLSMFVGCDCFVRVNNCEKWLLLLHVARWLFYDTPKGVC